ncbi:hypothetical protein BC937DRAFT_89891 [Endogone sp. FLAS-F59071]|nr:hypothetical protein BC937DRAFT_89891 [Endogone sp. FLAS-F59071]|eukprot:RUS22259.1 hypothetical protein BC937DRAFT_89891 [Endogone sp. FLAS-F59071]
MDFWNINLRDPHKPFSPSARRECRDFCTSRHYANRGHSLSVENQSIEALVSIKYIKLTMRRFRAYVITGSSGRVDGTEAFLQPPGLDGVNENGLCHGRAADVAVADKEDVEGGSGHAVTVVLLFPNAVKLITHSALRTLTALPSFMAFPKRKSSTIALPLFHHQPAPTRPLRSTLLRAVIAIVFTTSLLINLFLSTSSFRGPDADGSHTAHESMLDDHQHAAVVPEEIPQDLAAEPMPAPPLEGLTDLIMVAGHAIFVGDDPNRVKDDEWWVLEEFQKGGQVATFVDHIKKGVEMVVKNEKALLVFSGGQTRLNAGSRSEGQSYWELAHDLDLFSPQPVEPSSPPASSDEETSLAYNASISPPFMRATTEEYARDSLDNLLFSVCRFYEMTGRYPETITVIGFAFKRNRFVDLHRAALRFPEERFTYIGIDPKQGTLQTMVGETLNSLGPFQEDLYGCHGKLREKKLQRNPFRRR